MARKRRPSRPRALASARAGDLVMKNDSLKKAKKISFGKRLRSCPNFSCLGVNPNWEDYPAEAQARICAADRVYYPTSLYETALLSLGKSVFPHSYYGFLGNKIQQSNLFQLLNISHPKTRIYRGKNRRARVFKDFSMPFVAKTPVGSSQGRGVFLIEDESALDTYLQDHPVAYIQEYLPIDRDLRIVLIAGRVVHAYWRLQHSKDFRNNVSQGATISFDDIPEEALQFAEDVARRCRFDDVGLDVCHARGRCWVIEANMAYGLEGFRQAGLNLQQIFARLDEDGFL